MQYGRRWWRPVMVAAMICGLALAGGCQATKVATSQAAATQPMSAGEMAALREVLPGMAKAHGEKKQLAWYAGSILRPVDPVFEPFFRTMGEKHKELLTQLQAWATRHNFDLKYSYPDTMDGAARKLDEARQEVVVRGANQADFQRIILVQMYSEYEWEICMIKALQPKVTDAGLQDYLAKSLAVHEAGAKEIDGLLKKYQLTK